MNFTEESGGRQDKGLPSSLPTCGGWRGGGCCRGRGLRFPFLGAADGAFPTFGGFTAICDHLDAEVTIDVGTQLSFLPFTEPEKYVLI